MNADKGAHVDSVTRAGKREGGGGGREFGREEDGVGVRQLLCLKFHFS